MASEQVQNESAEVRFLTQGDLVKLHASRAAKALGMGVGEFLAKWVSGELDARLEESTSADVLRWRMLMSFGRPDAVGGR